MKHSKDKEVWFQVDYWWSYLGCVKSPTYYYSFGKIFDKFIQCTKCRWRLRNLKVFEIKELKEKPTHDDSQSELKILPSHLKYVCLEEVTTNQQSFTVHYLLKRRRN